MTEQKKEKLFLSIVVAVYNAEKYLNQCVDSILSQSFSDFELILVDDGSKDSSPIICDEYVEKDERVFVIHQPNGGPVKARVAGMNKARGEYIYFVDSDDWLEPNALKIACQSAKDNNADIVTFDSYFCYANDRKVALGQIIESGVYDKKALKEKFYPRMLYSGRFFYFGIYAAMWNKIFRKSVVYENMIHVDPKIRIGEDGLTTFASMLDAKKVCVLSTYHLYNYRDNNTSITRSYCVGQFENAKSLTRTLYDISAKKKVYDLSGQIDYYFMYHVYSISIEEFYFKYKKSLLEKIKHLKEIVNDELVREVVARIDYRGMDRSHKVFFKLLKRKKTTSIIIWSILIATDKRFRLFIKKLLGKY